MQSGSGPLGGIKVVNVVCGSLTNFGVFEVGGQRCEYARQLPRPRQQSLRLRLSNGGGRAHQHETSDPEQVQAARVFHHLLQH